MMVQFSESPTCNLTPSQTWSK